ncbi:putative basic amino acid antiporter YfcC [Salmonella enterica subsp. enterica serovar Portland]|uniref:YfcC family protein n=1 Tax=Salmonella enterica TaxID=28901 RepID=UPI00128A5DFB|nr:putative basic amino acid antiporter YfcC [Salmonella enterica]EBX6016686.1 putative basic amino acid antiporter YfcC [Salmonella enterica subsp. enterica serovar Dortmund]ECA8969888.1 putative basic amino acid antiporter YfcC [Salmonella enterica subsp. enterica serovar Omuna]ECI3850794.1 putative basic amino acid antiporter YfcC [Salmonella enterica subsp. enterica]EDH5631928.1 YfcC family protein [Salmonella enterica subsp. enterica serovar Claibornei]EDS6037332.1 putative basic amino ac
MRITKIKWAMPHCYALIFFIIVVVALLTWWIPSGSFNYHTVTLSGGETKTVVIPGSYHLLEKVSANGDLRQGVAAVLAAPMEGVIKAVDVVAFVLIVGGAFGIILRTGAIERGLLALADRLAGKGLLVIPLSMTLFSLGGATFGMSEEVIPLYAIFISLMFALGYDSMTAILILFLGTQIGYVGAMTNPFSVLIAQGVAGIQGNPQLWLRAIAWLVFTLLAIGYTMWYAHRVKCYPHKSPVYENDRQTRAQFLSTRRAEVRFSLADRLIILAFVLALALICWGLITRGWYMVEIGSVFLALGLFSGIVGRMSVSGMADSFVEGCKEFVYAAVVIGLARGILVVAENGRIIDTMLYGLSEMLEGLPQYAFTTLMLLGHNVITFFVPSSSGEAALTMPVLAPLGDLVGINKEAMVMAYQFGNGLTNLISPTGGVLLAGLSIARIGFGQWLKAIAPLFPLLWIMSAVFAAISASV